MLWPRPMDRQVGRCDRTKRPRRVRLQGGSQQPIKDSCEQLGHTWPGLERRGSGSRCRGPVPSRQRHRRLPRLAQSADRLPATQTLPRTTRPAPTPLARLASSVVRRAPAHHRQRRRRGATAQPAAGASAAARVPLLDAPGRTARLGPHGRPRPTQARRPPDRIGQRRQRLGQHRQRQLGRRYDAVTTPATPVTTTPTTPVAATPTAPSPPARAAALARATATATETATEREAATATARAPAPSSSPAAGR